MTRRPGLLGVALLLGWAALQGQATPPAGATVGGRLASPALGVTKRYLVHLPPSYATHPGRIYPVIYLLHGLTGTEADWLTRGDLAAIADSLVASGGPEVIYVMPDGDNGWWSNWAATLTGADCLTDPAIAESAATFCVARAAYGDYLADDLVRHVDATLRTIADRGHRGVAGISMGGTGALTLGLTRPDRFAAIVALSAPASPLRVGTGEASVSSLPEWESARGRPLNPPWRARWGADTGTWWRHDPARAARRLAADAAPRPRILIEVGTDDPYLTENRVLAAELDRLGIAHRYAESSGAHDWQFWRGRVPAALAWLAEAVSR